MEGNKCLTSIQPLNYEVFVGMDTDKRSIAMSVYDHTCKIESKVMPHDGGAVVKYLNRKYSNKKIAFVYEAGPTGFGLYDALTKEGYDCLVTSPSTVPREPAARVKTNRLDSEKLATTLRGGQIRGIRVPSEPYRHLRDLTHLRDTLVKNVIATKCRIKALLLMKGLEFPEAPPTSQWSNRVTEQLKRDPQYEAIRFELDQLLEILSFTHTKILQVQREVRRFCKADPDISESINYMTSIPGIGPITASEVLARIGDWRNLRNSREVGAFFGLVPCEYSTGDDVRRGNITRMGHQKARNMLIEASWVAIRKDGELREFYKQVYSNHNKNYAARKAIVAVARKLTARIYVVLKNRRQYEIRKKVIVNPSTQLRVDHEPVEMVTKIETVAPKDDSTKYRT